MRIASVATAKLPVQPVDASRVGAEKRRLSRSSASASARARDEALEAFLLRALQVTGDTRPMGRLPRRRVAARGSRASAAAAIRRLQLALGLEVLAARREVVRALRGDGARVFADAVFAAGLRLELPSLAVPAGLRDGDPAPGVRPDAALVHLRGRHGLQRQQRFERACRVRVRHADGAVDEPPALDPRARGARPRLCQRPPPLASRGQALDLALGHAPATRVAAREDEPRGRDGRRIRRHRVERRAIQTRGAFVLLPRPPGDVRLERVRGAREGGRDARFRRRRRFRIVLLEVIVAVIVLFLLLFLVEIVLVLLNGGDARSAEGRRCPPF